MAAARRADQEPPGPPLSIARLPVSSAWVIQKEFFASAKARGHAPEKIEDVGGLVAGFAGYAFCKAHSTAYGVEAYQAAWLKRNYPAESWRRCCRMGKVFTTRWFMCWSATGSD